MIEPRGLEQHVLACAIDGAGLITWASPAWTSVLGVPAESMTGRRWLDLVHPADRPRALLGAPRSQIRVAGFDAPRWIDWSCVRMDGGWLGIGHDVTELAAAEHALRVQLEILRVIGEAPTLGAAWPGLLGVIAAEEEWTIAVLWRMDPTGDRMHVESVWRGGEDRELLESWRPVRLARGEETAGEAWARGRPVRSPIPVAGRGSPRLRLALGSGLRGAAAIPLRDGGRVVGVIEGLAVEPRRADEAWVAAMTQLGQAVGQQIRHREQEDDFARAARRFEFAVTNAPVVLFAIDADARILHISGGALTMRSDALVGRSVFDLFPADSAASHDIKRALAGEEFTDIVHIPRTDQWYETRYSPVRDHDGRVAGVTGVGVDVTRHRRTEDALHEAERLAALGTLAAGIGHEINNPLTYVRLNLGRLISFEAAQRPRTPDHMHRLEILNECREGIGRVEEIVRDLRLFARAEDGEDRPVKLVDVVEAAIRMAEHEIRPRARLAREFRAQPVVRGNEGKLVQVLLNILVNAAQSIEEGHAHLNRIKVAVSVDERGWGVVEVADTGPGMSEDVREKAFEPFFTTKPIGAGTGLGLSLCRSIVSRLGGSIDVDAEEPHGTRVRVALPSAEWAEAQPPAQPEKPPEERKQVRRRILIVDDEREIAAAVAAILAPMHDVSVAGSGREAIEILRRDDEFDLILCDVTMPEIGGREVYDLLRLTRPSLAERIVFMTGGAYTPQAARFISSVPNPTIEKPFDIDELMAAVEQLLGPAPTPPERRRMV